MRIESPQPATLARVVAAGGDRKLAALVATVVLAGCSLLPERPNEPDGTWCYRIGKTDRQTVTCTPYPVPPREVEQSAKQFLPAPNWAAIYVVRKRLGDVANQVPVVIDGQPPVITVPSSMFRVRVAPGQHTLSLTWKGERKVKVVEVSAAQLIFVEIDGSVWNGRSAYEWSDSNSWCIESLANRAKLIADVDLRVSR